MSVHISVLMNETIRGLDIQPDDIIIDGTINGGGHAYEISKRLSDKGVLIGIDQDSTGLEVSRGKLKDATTTVHLVHDNTRNISDILSDLDIQKYDKLLNAPSFKESLFCVPLVSMKLK